MKRKHQPIFIIKASQDEKDWESTIHLFAIIAIGCLVTVLFLILATINLWNQVQEYKTSITLAEDEMRVWHTEYDKCIYEKEHMPIINGIEVTIHECGDDESD